MGAPDDTRCLATCPSSTGLRWSVPVTGHRLALSKARLTTWRPAVDNRPRIVDTWLVELPGMRDPFDSLQLHNIDSRRHIARLCSRSEGLQSHATWWCSLSQRIEALNKWIDTIDRHYLIAPSVSFPPSLRTALSPFQAQLGTDS